MTTTHTFQGLNADGKTSSRVLNPPGGSSSNIFGVSDEKPPQRSPVQNPDNVNRGNNDVFGQGHNAAPGPQQKNSRAPRSAYNPITGEAYEQPKGKQEDQAPVSKISENASSRTDKVASGRLDAAEPPSSATVSDQTPQPAEADEKSQPEEKQQPAEQEKPQPTVTPVTAQAADQKKQQQSGLFGRSEDVKEHTSTRVSQPPGGRSTKLW